MSLSEKNLEFTRDAEVFFACANNHENASIIKARREVQCSSNLI